VGVPKEHPLFVSGSELLRHHDLKLVLLATAICALGSFMTLFLFAQAREIRGEARSGWLFLAGFAAGSVTWTVNFVALLAFQPGVGVAYNAALAGAAFFVAVVMATSGLAIATYGRGRSGYLGGSVLGLGIAATHLIGIASLHVAGSLGLNWVLAGTGAVLCMAGAALALDRARNEGRNVQVIAPILLACGMAVMHLVGMSALTLAADGGSTLPVNALTPSVLGYFVAAMAFLLMCTGLATTLIARGARKEAQTQLRNIANASVEGSS
jgi:NO-binding membrane sensor protein with MHYT domain